MIRCEQKSFRGSKQSGHNTERYRQCSFVCIRQILARVFCFLAAQVKRSGFPLDALANKGITKFFVERTSITAELSLRLTQRSKCTLNSLQATQRPTGARSQHPYSKHHHSHESFQVKPPQVFARQLVSLAASSKAQHRCPLHGVLHRPSCSALSSR